MSFFADGQMVSVSVAAMMEILNDEIPADLEPNASLPGVRPLGDKTWINVDATYAQQVAYRRHLIAQKRDAVLWQGQNATPAISEVYHEILQRLPAFGFSLTSRHIFCPDGNEVDREADNPLATLGKVVQEDICILQKQGDEHLLAAAILCFPAGWTLAEKAGRPLSRIHSRVDSYDASMARRVQRMFDGVQVGRPIWRNNYLPYDNPDLFQPLTEAQAAKHPTSKDASAAPYLRAERQSILRLPETQAVVFTIHTYVARVQPE